MSTLSLVDWGFISEGPRIARLILKVDTPKALEKPTDKKTPMAGPLEYRIYDRQQHVFTAELVGAIELGRQDRGEEGPYTLLPKVGQSRLILAKFDEDKISRKHVLIEPLAGGYLKLTHFSKTLSVPIQNGSDLTE